MEKGIRQTKKNSFFTFGRKGNLIPSHIDKKRIGGKTYYRYSYSYSRASAMATAKRLRDKYGLLAQVVIEKHPISNAYGIWARGDNFMEALRQ